MLARLIIVNWNGRRWLDGCLAGVDGQGVAGVEVVVVDNGSTDGSVDWLRGCHPGVRVIALDRNTGFARGCNRGAAGAGARYLIFLNNDTRARPGWLAALVEAAERDPSVGLVTSQVVFLDRPDLVDSAGDGYLRCGGAFKHAHGQPAAGAPGSREVFGACGAAFLIRRELFERLGGFDEEFDMVYEDVDLSYRARLAGARVWYAAGAVVEHAGSASLGRVSPEAVFYGQRNLEWTWIKNTPRALLWRSAPAHVAYGLAAAVGFLRRGRGGAWLRGKAAALAGLGRQLAKRRAVQKAAVAPPAALWTHMTAGWIALKRREKRFDFR